MAQRSILHVVPDSVGNTKKAFVGSTKDIRGRTEYFQARGIAYHEHLSAGRSDEALVQWLRQADLSGYDAIIVEYESYIESLRYLRDAHPHIRRIVRSHNSNLPHQFDNFLGRVRMGKGADAAADVAESLMRFRQDCECAELADVMLPITEWEARHYWSRIGDPSRVIAAPYFLPQTFAVEPPATKTRNLCVCFMGTGGNMTPLLYDAARNTIDLVAAAGDKLKDWDFAITGSLKPKDVLGTLGRVKPTGLLDSPYELLREARVVTLLSDLGMGFKTKILEAVMAGCWVLLTPDVWARLPDAVKPWCKPVPAGAVDAFVEAVRECAVPPPPDDPNAALRDAAFSALDTALSRGDGMSARASAA